MDDAKIQIFLATQDGECIWAAQALNLEIAVRSFCEGGNPKYAIGDGIVWFEMDSSTKNEILLSRDGFTPAEKEKFSAKRITDRDVAEAVEVLENDQLATFVVGTPRAPGFKIPEPPADL